MISKIFISVFLMVFSATSFAFDNEAQKLFDNGQYEDSIRRITSRPELKKNLSNVMLLAYSNLQLGLFTKQDSYSNEYDTYHDLFAEKVGIDDLSSILFFVNSSDKPEVVKSAREVLRDVLEKITKVDDIIKMVPFTESSDMDSREYALSSMHRILEPIRDIVNDGGTMRPVDLKVFQNQTIIKAAIQNIEKIPAASKVLVDIEEPALESLKTSANEKGSKDVIDDINSAIAKRLKTYPNSTWYSATGKKIVSR